MRPVYQKPPKANKRPTAAQRRMWNQIAALGCILCGRPAEIHHCGTGGGGRKNHDYVIPLCPEHHRGVDGIDGGTMSKRNWQQVYGSERELHEKTLKMLAMEN